MKAMTTAAAAALAPMVAAWLIIAARIVGGKAGAE